MIHGDVKRDGSRCRLETQSLPIHERPMLREKTRLLLLGASKRQSIKRVDIGKAPGGPLDSLAHNKWRFDAAKIIISASS
jgi:hypothetical protein